MGGGRFRYSAPPENRASATPSTKTPPTTKPNQAERINNTMSSELLKGKVFRSIEEVIAAVALAVDFYNNRRPHIEHRDDDSYGSIRVNRRQGYEMDELHASGNKIQG